MIIGSCGWTVSLFAYNGEIGVLFHLESKAMPNAAELM